MAEELKVRIIFETGQADKPLTDTAKKIQYTAGSVGDLELKLKEARKALREVVPGSQQYTDALNNVRAAQANLINVQRDLSDVNRGSQRTTANLSNALMAMNYTVRDSPYFFRSFSLGLLSVGNNLNPLIDSLIAVKKEAAAAGKSMIGELKTALMGSQGIIFGFSLLVSVLQAVVFAMEKTDKKAQENKKSYEELTEALDEYNATLKETKKIDKELKDTKYTEEIEKQEQKLADAQVELGKYYSSLRGNKADQEIVKSLTSAIDEQRKGLQKLKDVMNGSTPEVAKYRDKIYEVVRASEKMSKETLLDWIEKNKLNSAVIDATVSSLEQEGKQLAYNSEAYRGNLEVLEKLKDVKNKMSGKEDKSAGKAEHEKASAEKEYRQLAIENIDNLYEREIAKARETFREKKEQLDNLFAKGLLNKNQFAEAVSGAAKVLEREIAGITSKRYDVAFSFIGEAKGLEMGKQQSEFFEKVKQSFLDNGYEWSMELQAFYLKLAMRLNRPSVQELKDAADRNYWAAQMGLEVDENGLMIPVKVKPISEKDSVTGQIDKDLKELEKERLKGLERISDVVGDSLADAFLRGKNGLDGLIDSLKEAVAQMLIMDGIKTLFSYATGGEGVGLFAGLFSTGGIVPDLKAANGAVVGGNSYYGDRLLAGVNSGEMILNKQQQLGILNLLSNANFGRMQNEQHIRISIDGKIRAKGKDFVADFKKVEDRINRTRLK